MRNYVRENVNGIGHWNILNRNILNIFSETEFFSLSNAKKTSIFENELILI